MDHRAFWYEWEGEVVPHSVSLIAALRASQSVIISGAPEMERRQTNAWTAFEVGVAAQLGLPIWLIEEFGRESPAPIPQLTGYIQRPSRLDKKKTFPFFEIVNDAGTVVPRNDEMAWPNGVTCPVEHCRARYFLYVLGSAFTCPVCRYDIKIEGTKLKKAWISSYH
jgi:hypothetical protein